MKGDEVKLNVPIISVVILFLSSIFLLFISITPLTSAATFDQCWNLTGTSNATCSAFGSGSECAWETSATDDFCTDGVGCCFDLGCWQYDGTNNNTCANVTINGNLTCSWDSTVNIFFPGNDTVEYVGACKGEFEGADEGCWQYDGDIASCNAPSNTCNWKANDANQNTWCGVKSLSDAQGINPEATSADIGCCEQPGCWNYDFTNQSVCGSAFGGLCNFDSGSNLCETKWCGDVTTEDDCSALHDDLFIPCSWNSGGGVCESIGGGGFGLFDGNNSDSCFDAGGWYNSTGNCVLPGDGGGFGGGEFLFSSDATCWFADGQINMCGNVTGCAYCTSGVGPNGILNSSGNNICYNKAVDLCEGRDTSDLNTTYSNANNTVSLACTDIEFKSACNYGPLPSCKWTNSSVTFGSYCEVGASATQKSSPPVDFCEHPDAKNNYTMCTSLATDYLMPCVWENSTYPVQNCTFNEKAVFGLGGENDFGDIGSESSCTAAGGTWNTEFYVDNNILKQDSWCELTGFFDIDNGGGEGNKASCDSSCWACEFQQNGSAWANEPAAQSACESSDLGLCSFTGDSGAFNGYGWCDYPHEMESAGSGDCNSECGSCDFMNDPFGACESSQANEGAGCQWVNDSSDEGGFCVGNDKKICDNDCFSCNQQTECLDSSVSCTWDNDFGLCKPQGFEGEICFDGFDNDGDTLIDCGDPDCGFDNFCGGGNFGGDCFAQSDATSCNATAAFDSLNCTWINDTWNPTGWCDMPGAACYQYDNNLTACGLDNSCTNKTSFSGGFCDINFTTEDGAGCPDFSDISSCTGASDCNWVNDSFNANVGWCDYAPFATCENLTQYGDTSCNSNANCVWNQDQFSDQGGWCDVACFNQSITGAGDCNTLGTDLCEYRSLANTCQPSIFEHFGSKGAGGKSGCYQYDGNFTGCEENSVTCTFVNDSFVNNNQSIGGESGWCMDKAEFEHFGQDSSPPTILSFDDGNIGGSESGVDSTVDIVGLGIKVDDDAFNFGGEVWNVTDSAMCNGYQIGKQGQLTNEFGRGNESTSFYWYMDADGNTSGGCTAIDQSGGSNAGYDFLISYSSRNTSNGILDTKQLSRCNAGSWTLTNALVTTSKKISCNDIGGVMVAIEKEDLDSFDGYEDSEVMKVFMVSANSSGNRTNPTDSIPAGYYTPGTIGFNFVDCSDPDTQDPKCKNIQKFGFNVFEECLNGIDDNEDGLVDCADPICTFAPSCGSAFSFDINSSDKTAPVVSFSEVDTLYDSSFVRIDTDGPSNLSLTFYSEDSECLVANVSVNDSGLGYQANANFKPFHDVDLINDELGFPLINGTTYFYKTTTCDPSNNCAVSACANFTTEDEAVDREFIFKMDLPDGYTVDIPALNKTGYNFTTIFNGEEYDVGVKTNTSVTKNMNMTVHCGDMALGFFGINVFEPVSIDLSSAFICNTTTDLMGMNSTLKKWNKLIDELNLGGAQDYIEITLPDGYNTSNNFTWDSDNADNPQNVSNYVDCSGNTTETVCDIPVSMGFSGYTVNIPSSGSGGSGGGDSGGSSGGSSGSGTTISADPAPSSNATTVENDTGVEETTGETIDEPAVEEEITIPEEEKSFAWAFIALGLLLALGVIGFAGSYFAAGKFSKFKK